MKRNTQILIAVLSVFTVSLSSFMSVARAADTIEAQVDANGTVTGLTNIVISADAQSGSVTTDNTALSTTMAAPAPMTGGMLKQTLDKMIAGTSGKEGDAFCSALDVSYASLSAEERQSLAWRKESYALYGKTSVGLSEGQSALWKSARASLEASNTIFDSIMPATSDKNGVLLARSVAVVRSGMVELGSELSTKSSNPSRAENIATFLSHSVTCLEENASSDEASLDAVSNLKASLAGFAVAWDEGKDGTAAPAPAPMNIRVSNIDVSPDTKTIASATAVKSEDDLALFANGVVKNDPYVKSVEITDDSVAVSYVSRAKFLGLIPGWVTVTGSANVDGSIDVNRSWYSFLMAKKPHVDEEMLAAELKASGTTLDTSLAAKSKTLVSLSHILNAASTAKASVETDTTSVE